MKIIALAAAALAAIAACKTVESASSDVKASDAAPAGVVTQARTATVARGVVDVPWTEPGYQSPAVRIALPATCQSPIVLLRPYIGSMSCAAPDSNDPGPCVNAPHTTSTVAYARILGVEDGFVTADLYADERIAIRPEYAPLMKMGYRINCGASDPQGSPVVVQNRTSGIVRGVVDVPWTEAGFKSPTVQIPVPKTCQGPVVLLRPYIGSLRCAEGASASPGKCRNSPNSTSTVAYARVLGVQNGVVSVDLYAADRVVIQPQDAALMKMGYRINCL